MDKIVLELDPYRLCDLLINSMKPSRKAQSTTASGRDGIAVPGHVDDEKRENPTHRGAMRRPSPSRHTNLLPADSNEAIRQLETIRARGTQYLLLPVTSFWPLDRYQGFGDHLERHYRVVVHADRICIILDLRQ